MKPLSNINIDWVLVRRHGNKSANATNDSDNDCAACSDWDFVTVFGEKGTHDTKIQSTVAASTSSPSVTSTPTNRVVTEMDDYIYFDRSNCRRGWRVFENVENIDEISPYSCTTKSDVSAKRRKITNGFWRMRYNDSSPRLATENTRGTSDTEGSVYEERFIDPRQLIPIYSSRTGSTKNVTIENTSSPSATRSPILIADTTEIYRLLAGSQIQNGDNCTVAVLEIGSSTGGTSEILWDHIQHQPNGRWMGFDTGADMVHTLQNKLHRAFPQLKGSNYANGNVPWAVCHHIDPLLDPDTATMIVKRHFGRANSDITKANDSLTVNVTVFLDIGGNREEGAVLRMIDWALRAFHNDSSEPSNTCKVRLHQIIVKSETIYSAFSMLVKTATSSSPKKTFESSESWYNTRLSVALRNSFPKHPLQAPKRFVPTTLLSKAINFDDYEKKYICRYYNYHKDGCAKKTCNISGIPCPYDHEHCHLCLDLGHIARVCPLIYDVVSEN
jgi:hypothetical protein